MRRAINHFFWPSLAERQRAIPFQIKDQIIIAARYAGFTALKLASISLELFTRLLYYNLLMKLMAIDYGAKRVGLASTDESGQFALPRMVFLNDENLLEKVLEFKKKEGIEKIILG